MNLFQASNQCFNFASVLYAIAFVLYVGHLISEKKIYDQGAPWLGRAAWLMHTTALILRWMHSGIAHPPWTNLYESLVFFSWGVMTIHIIIEHLRGFKLTGVFATGVVFAAMGIASLHPHKEIEPLVPALQSWWLLFHVFMACIAYAFFMASSFVSVFYLLKDEVKVEKMTAVAALVCVLFLCIAVGKSFFLSGEIQFYKIVQMEGKEVIFNFKGPDGKPMQQFVNLPGAVFWVWPLLALYLGSAIAFLRATGVRAVSAAKAGRGLFLAAFALHVAFLIYTVASAKSIDGMALKSNPYRVAAIGMTLWIAGFFVILMKFKDRVLKRLPSLTTLDRWGYQGILAGVPFMTINLISGGVWAYYAWGRYWGWDPKETWAFITWVVYLIYLHMRILGGWRGRKTAYISVLGFFVVIFTYLGVNLVISGLHSYATQ